MAGSIAFFLVQDFCLTFIPVALDSGLGGSNFVLINLILFMFRVSLTFCAVTLL